MNKKSDLIVKTNQIAQINKKVSFQVTFEHSSFFGGGGERVAAAGRQAFFSCSDGGSGELLSSCRACAGFSLRWLLLLQNTGSRARGLSCPQHVESFQPRN